MKQAAAATNSYWKLMLIYFYYFDGYQHFNENTHPFHVTPFSHCYASWHTFHLPLKIQYSVPFLHVVIIFFLILEFFWILKSIEKYLNRTRYPYALGKLEKNSSETKILELYWMWNWISFKIANDGVCMCFRWINRFDWIKMQMTKTYRPHSILTSLTFFY